MSKLATRTVYALLGALALILVLIADLALSLFEPRRGALAIAYP